MKQLESNFVAIHVRQRLLVANHGGRLMTNGGRTEIIMMIRKQKLEYFLVIRDSW